MTVGTLAAHTADLVTATGQAFAEVTGSATGHEGAGSAPYFIGGGTLLLLLLLLMAVMAVGGGREHS